MCETRHLGVLIDVVMLTLVWLTQGKRPVTVSGTRRCTLLGACYWSSRGLLVLDIIVPFVSLWCR